MHVNIVTLFPEWFDSPLKTALLGRAVDSGLVDFTCVNPRDETHDPHRTVDDRPYGGGPGMVMMLNPLVSALRRVDSARGLGRVIMLSASGRPMTQEIARELALEPVVTLICGRYEGIDGRLPDIIPMEQISVGEAVLNGGESAAMMIIEAATRLIPGFMGKEESGDAESFSDGLLEHPHFTRPEVFDGLEVPEVLRNGNHAAIAQWRREQSLETTLAVRPAMLENAPLSYKDVTYLRQRLETIETLGSHLHVAIVLHPVMLGWKKVGSTALTNVDLKDIAHCSRMYALAGSYVIVPEAAQAQAEAMCAQEGGKSDTGLGTVRCETSLEAVIASIQETCGERPCVALANAVSAKNAETTCGALRKTLRDRHVLLVFATGFGLAPDIREQIDITLRPIRALRGNNQLPARSAALIWMDRLLNDMY